MKAIADKCDLVIVVGAPNSSNSLRLVEVAERAGCPKAMLVQSAADIPWDAFEGIKTLGVDGGRIRSGTPRHGHYRRLRRPLRDATIEQVVTREENIGFNVPRELREPGAP